MMIRYRVAVCTIATCLAIIAPASANQLSESEWRPIKIGHEKLLNVKPFVRFGENGRVTGNGGCNGFSGYYQLRHEKIKIGRLMSTMMACSGKSVMKYERLFLRALRQARYIERNGTRLILIDGVGEAFAELIERH